MSSAGARRNNNANSNKPRRNTNSPRPAVDPTPGEFWRTPPKSAVPSPITPAADATALLRSLGRPPLPGQVSADRHVATVIERAAALATALAVAADLLVVEED